MCTQKATDCKELPHALREAGESPDLQLATGRSRRAAGVSSSPKASGLETGEGSTFQSESEGRKRLWPSSSIRLGELPLTQTFVLFGPSPDWTRPTVLGRATCFIQSIHSNAKLPQKQGHTQHEVWPKVWVPRDPVRLTHTMNPLTWPLSL